MAPLDGDDQRMVERLQEGTILIAGGGPVGLILAKVLAHHGVKSVLFERNKTTTHWPKMDLTNARSMELFRTIGLADNLRSRGVPPHLDQDVIISSGLSMDEPLTLWKLPGVDKFSQIIRDNNDGTQPLEPWQRISQAIFEKWLKAVCDNDPLIDIRVGHKLESVETEEDGARVVVTDVDTETTKTFFASYVVGCDGASSRVRKSLGSELDGGPVPVCAVLVHFKSRDLTRLHKQGRFWHIFFLEKEGGLGGAIIAQDEVDTWTTHLFLPLDVDTEAIDSHEVVYRVLGGLYGEYKIAIDEILVRSTWQPHIAVARAWSSPNQRVFIAGDAAHQNIPTGGYGMNMGIVDAFNLGWKLAAAVKGQGGQNLLRSYELERKPVAILSTEHSGVHFQVHGNLKEILKGGDPRRVDGDTDEARRLRATIHNFYQEHDGENKDFGIEMGYRYKSPVIITSTETDQIEPVCEVSQYTPTTWPGGRPPHVYLSDNTAIFDKFGKDWTLLVFSHNDCGQHFFFEAAKSLSMSLEIVDLSSEAVAKALYERNLVLIRPDQHVAWRADNIALAKEALDVLQVVTGRI